MSSTTQKLSCKVVAKHPFVHGEKPQINANKEFQKRKDVVVDTIRHQQK
jgi:hypothetical protein